MSKMIVTLTTVGGDREDGNVYYSPVRLIEETETAKFSDLGPIHSGMIDMSFQYDEEEDQSEVDEAMSDPTKWLKSRGFIVHPVPEVTLNLEVKY